MPESSSVPEPEASPSPPPAAARPVKPLPEVSFEVQEPAPGGRRGLVVALVVLVLLGGTAGGAFYYFKIRGAGKAVASGTNAVVAISGGGNGTSDTNGGAFNAPVTPTKGKSLDDLKVGAPALEKAKAGSLVYVVGALKNESDHQRYGVRAEFELLDAAGRPVGKTSDYRDVVEPRREWRFRALVLTKKAVSARLIGVSEDP